MLHRWHMIVGLAVSAACLSTAIGDEPGAKAKARVELRWVESKPVEGLTEAQGFQCSCDPESVVYLHRTPALTLTPADVTEVRMTRHDFSRSGLSSENYMVALHLTQDARDRLAATCDGPRTRMLTILVDGKTWGVHRYEVDPTKEFVPRQCRAEMFLPEVGFFSSEAAARRLVDALQ